MGSHSHNEAGRLGLCARNYSFGIVTAGGILIQDTRCQSVILIKRIPISLAWG